ncbi:hypothetical protein [Tessaracoccus oleiagri]|uniref:Energy-coupling factor transport system substrate-specific component n=1 Tax=Tessaracoccus oleiagri TaxID=686624 RepID=A0A1G9I7K3_9ACTN|nr:hypothetical protein [Tessaracoccus oleiagri]SDL20794.1 energy-coupling factor transport system substrate-specific component [Tessaracoccus oleiagri]
MSFVESIKKDFSLMAILLIPMAVAINFVGGSLALALKLPVYLDSIGTFIVAMLAGPWVGAVTGAISLLTVSITDPTSLPWTMLAAFMGAFVGWMARRRMFTNWWKIAIATLLVIIGSVLAVVAIRYIVFGGFSSHVSSAIAAGLIAAGFPFWFAQMSSSFVLELPDKVLTVLIAVLVIRAISDRYLLKFSNGRIFVDARRARRDAKRGVEAPTADAAPHA